jgi:cytochrome c oxidase subunit 3
MGLWLLLVSLGVLFIATIFCGWYLRDTGAAAEHPLPDLPSSLWLTTALLAGLSFCAGRAARLTDPPGQAKFLRLSMVFAVLFLGGQVLSWVQLMAAEIGDGVHPMYAFNFYLMTVLHAVHVIGGLVYNALALLAVKVGGGMLRNRSRNNATYWHFLGAVWIVILLNLMAVRIPDPEESFLAPLSLGVTGLLLAGFLYYQLRIIVLLVKRGERAFAFFSVLPPVAFMHAWARGEEIGTQKLALHWAILQGLLLIALMFTITIHIGQFADSYDVGAP